MYFLINPAKKKRGRKAAKRRRRAMPARGKGGKFVKRKRATGARRRVRRTQGQTQSKGGSMARRRRRRSVVRHSAPRRRRRRSAVVYMSNPRRRRRRVVARRRHSVRRYRRNPGGSGVVSTIKQGVKDGALILAGQAVQGRVSAMAARVVPIGGLAGAVVTDVGAAVAVTILARKFAPGAARMISGGAFANAVKRVVTAVSPTAGGLLGDSEQNAGGIPLGGLYEADALSAYPDNMGAYPLGLGDASDSNVVYS